MAEGKTFSAKQVATRIHTEAKMLRKFLRDPKSGYEAVGQGGRYDFPESEIPKIQEAFNAWAAGKVRRNRPTNAEREAAKKATVPPQKKAEPTQPRRRRNEPEASPLDGDDLLTRCRQSIGERARAKGLTTNKQGRWVTKPGRLLTVAELEEKVPGFKKAREAADAKWNDRQKQEFDEVLGEVLEEAHPELGQKEYDELVDALDEIEEDEL